MKKPLVSIIIPMYNMENYVYECVNSLLNQTMKQIEIIIIDDGSTDSSPSIVKDLKRRDERIKYIRKENGGVSSARNEGLVVAKGEYIAFVDPDDYVSSGMYEKLYKTAKNTGCDLVMCNYYSVVNGVEFENILSNINYNSIYLKENIKNILNRLIGCTNSEFRDILAGNDSVLLDGFVWRSIYKRELIVDNKILFDNDIIFREDEFFNLRFLLKASKIFFIPECLYFYRKQPSSICSRYKPNYLDIEKKNWERRMEIIGELRDGEELNTRFSTRVCLDITEIISNICRLDNPQTYSEKLKSISDLLQEVEVIKALHYINIPILPLNIPISCRIKWLVWILCKKNKKKSIFIVYSLRHYLGK